MNDIDQRARIEKALRHRSVPIPPDLQPEFEAYQLQHYRHFLLAVNLLAQFAYVSYGLADLLVLPDIGWISPLLRTLFAVVTLPIVFWFFYRSQNVRLMDQLLPILILVASIVWYEMLAHSSSASIPNYVYASLIFIVLANLCVQVDFRRSLYVSVLIAGYTLWAVHRLNNGDWMAVGVFVLVYLPVLLFSLFNSWSTTQDRRRSFLRAQLEEMTSRDLALANRQLEILAHTDSLTQVSNRRHFEERARREVERTLRHHTALSLLILDVDHFKRINDTYGHAAGDRLLQQLCVRAGGALRDNDLLARCGGEEFHVLLPDTELADALLVAERLRLALADCQVPIDGGESVRFTVSIGAAQLEAGVEDIETTIRRADQALYAAKTSGRNRVCA